MEKLVNMHQNILNEQRIKHTWKKIENSRKLQHAECIRCKSQKWWDDRFGKLIYVDRFGKTHYRAPDCAYPNTKI